MLSTAEVTLESMLFDAYVALDRVQTMLTIAFQDGNNLVAFDMLRVRAVLIVKIRLPSFNHGERAQHYQRVANGGLCSNGVKGIDGSAQRKNRTRLGQS